MGTITRGIANNILGSGAVDGTDGLSGTVPANNIANASLNNITSLPPSVDAGIPSVAGNPPSPSDGDVWYNSSTYKLRVRGVAASTGSWASGGTLNQGRKGLGLGTLGTQAAAIAISGDAPPGTIYTNVEYYNGSAWTEGADVNTAVKYGAASGSPTSAIKYTGNQDPQTVNAESWNGSSWTEVGNVNNARSSVSGAGADNTTAIAMSGYNNPPGSLAYVETWNGSSWTETTDVNTARWGGGSIGLTNDGLLVGGYTTTALGNTETWNGSSWTEVADLNTAGYEGAGAGITSNGIYYGGSSRSGKTESWNGTAWTEIADIPVSHSAFGGGGTAISAIAYGGNPAPNNTSSYEFTGAADNLDVTLS